LFYLPVSKNVPHATKVDKVWLSGAKCV